MTEITLNDALLSQLKKLKIEPVTEYDQPARIPSGSLMLDYMLGGGLPRGRMSMYIGEESFGKSTLAMLTAAYITEHHAEMTNGGLVCYIDSESTYDLLWAERLGIDSSRIALLQPESGEEATDKMLALIRANVFDLIIYDSIAETPWIAEVEGSMEDAHVGVGARKWNQFFRMLKKPLAQSDTALLMINQIRLKIGVMYGCFSYQTPILLADGTTMPIGKIVNQKLPVEVLSWNEETGEFEPKRVTSWFKNGIDVDEFTMSDNEIGLLEQEYRTLIARYPNHAGFVKVTSTSNHLIATPDGFKMNMELDLGDQILARHEKVVLSHDLEQLVLGSMFGDGSIRQGGHQTAIFREAHCEAQAEYVRWKQDCFGDLVSGDWVRPDPRQVGFRTKALSVFKDWKDLAYRHNGHYQHINEDMLQMLTPLSLAVWYQDDGYLRKSKRWNVRRNSISLHRTTDKEGRMIERIIGENFDLVCKVRSNSSCSTISFGGDQADDFERIIAPYVHPSMSYKLRTEDGIGSALSDLDMSWWTEQIAIPCEVYEIRRKVKSGREAVRYNLEVEDNATYVAGKHIIVHNSPETQPGGLGQKYAASIIARLKRPEKITAKSGDPVALKFRVKTTKNKTSPVGREAEVTLRTQPGSFGVQAQPELVELGKTLGIFTKEDGTPVSGACNYHFDGQQLGDGPGAKNALRALMAERSLSQRVEAAVREAMSVVDTDSVGGLSDGD